MAELKYSSAALNQMFALLVHVDEETAGYTEARNALVELNKVDTGKATAEEVDVEKWSNVWEKHKPNLVAALRNG